MLNIEQSVEECDATKDQWIDEPLVHEKHCAKELYETTGVSPAYVFP